MYVVISLSGGEQYILNILDNVDEKEYSIEILLPDRKCDREYELYNRNVKVYKYECSSYKKKIVQFYRFLKTKI